MSDSWRPHGLQPTRLLHPLDFPGKSTGVECHCLLRLHLLQMPKAHLTTHRAWPPADARYVLISSPSLSQTHLFHRPLHWPSCRTVQGGLAEGRVMNKTVMGSAFRALAEDSDSAGTHPPQPLLQVPTSAMSTTTASHPDQPGLLKFSLLPVPPVQRVNTSECVLPPPQQPPR